MQARREGCKEDARVIGELCIFRLILNFKLKMNFPRKGEEKKAEADKEEEIKDEIKGIFKMLRIQ